MNLKPFEPAWPVKTRVEVRLELRDVGAVVRRVQRREQLLHDLAAVVLEHALEAGDYLVAEGEVVGDARRRA